MANRTDPHAKMVHGVDPQSLIEAILRNRVYDSRFWKEKCFALDAGSVVDEAVRLAYIGGTYSAVATPCPFLCLLLKLLQLGPERAIVAEYVGAEGFKYLRALGAMYVRLTCRPEDVYTTLEPLLLDYRKLAVRSVSGWALTTMDAFVDDLLRGEIVCGVTLPHLPKRPAGLPPRSSPLGEELGLSAPVPGLLGKRPREEEEEEQVGQGGDASVDDWNAVRAKRGVAPLK